MRRSASASRGRSSPIERRWRGIENDFTRCLGWHWSPYVYSKTADDTDGAPVKALPRELVELARMAVAEAYGHESAAASGYAPDAAIINLYEPDAHLGLHQDGEEPADAPVV